MKVENLKLFLEKSKAKQKEEGNGAEKPRRVPIKSVTY